MIPAFLASIGVRRPDTLERLSVTLESAIVWCLAGLVLWMAARQYGRDSTSAGAFCLKATAVMGLLGLAESGRLLGAGGLVYAWDGPLHLPLLAVRVCTALLVLIGTGGLLSRRRTLTEEAALGAAALSLLGLALFNAWQISLTFVLWLFLRWAGRAAAVLGAVHLWRAASRQKGAQSNWPVMSAIAIVWFAAWPVFIRFAGNAAPPDADMASLGTMAQWIACRLGALFGAVESVVALEFRERPRD